ncbi:MAG: hypothetical protein AB8F95_19305 [Bacteroidia bacterium]
MKEINEQIEYGLDTIDPNRTVTVKLKDLLLMYKTFEEFNRFFHNPSHYPTLEDVNTYLGNKDAGAYAFIHKIYYHILSDYIPKDIEEKLHEEKPPFDNPKQPYYFVPNNDGKKKSLILAIDFLLKKAETLTTEIKSEKGASKDTIKLKAQIVDAINNLKLCEKHGLFAHKLSITEIPEEGSESHFTDFYLVDEGAIQQVPDWAIVKHGNDPITLSCFDLIVQKQH